MSVSDHEKIFIVMYWVMYWVMVNEKTFIVMVMVQQVMSITYRVKELVCLNTLQAP